MRHLLTLRCVVLTKREVDDETRRDLNSRLTHGLHCQDQRCGLEIRPEPHRRVLVRAKR